MGPRSLRRGDFTLFKVQGDHNPADIFTKCVNREVLDRHLGKLGLHRIQGRAATAPHAQLQIQTDKALMCVMAHAEAVTCIGATAQQQLPRWSDDSNNNCPVGFHSGDAVDKPVAYEMRVWKYAVCSVSIGVLQKRDMQQITMLQVRPSDQ